MSDSKLRLLNVALWLAPFRNDPKCWNKAPANYPTALILWEAEGD
jgi:hypothetical protein